jgi:hypothetical protein
MSDLRSKEAPGGEGDFDARWSATNHLISPVAGGPGLLPGTSAGRRLR